MRWRKEVCRVVIITSLFWILIDVIVLFASLDSGTKSIGISSDHKLNNLNRVRGNRNLDFAKPTFDSKVHEDLNKLLQEVSFASHGPGDLGKAFAVDESLSDLRKIKFKLNQFDLLISDMISVNRSLPDYRSPKCRESDYKYKNLQLPSVSIIIVFHNEAWSTLLRTLHSVIDRSPFELVEEIILIDDLSNRTYLNGPLDLYIQRLPLPVHLEHLNERSGLIKSRLKGAKMAKGKVLLFLDAHVEVTEGWLEPLLFRVMEDRRRIVSPIIDVISDETFEYLTATENSWGGFNWHMNFRWFGAPPRIMEKRSQDPSLPIQTPTIAGGLFAIDRQYFYDIGSYDEGMQVWGGENLELSFRVWMCGGSLEIHPCSRVGHVFRKTTPYTFPGGTVAVIQRNVARTVEVWMDEYKDFYFKSAPEAKKLDIGDVSARKELRKNLQCKSFRWYLENIFPESPIPADYLSIGMIKLFSKNLCLDAAEKPTTGKKASTRVSNCHHYGGTQVWSYSKRGEFRSNEHCLSESITSGENLEKIGLLPCSIAKPYDYQLFSYDAETKTIKSQSSGKCLQHLANNSVALDDCIQGKRSQMWFLENYKTRFYK